MTNGGPTAVLDEILEPITRAFSRDVAEALVKLKASPSAQARISELAEKCNEGQITTEERREYETYVHVGNLIGILQAKARRYLKQHAAS